MVKIRYAIADDHQVFRRGIISALSETPELKLVMEADNDEEVFKKFAKVQTGCAIARYKDAPARWHRNYQSYTQNRPGFINHHHLCVRR